MALPEFILAELPAASANQGNSVIVTDGSPTNGAVIAVSDGVQWLLQESFAVGGGPARIASQSTLSLDFAASDVTLNATQFTDNLRFGPDAALTTARTLNVPKQAKQFRVFNPVGSGANTLSVARGTTTVVVAAGEERLLYTDSSENGLVEFSAGAGSTTFLALTDTPSAFTGQANKAVAVNAGATALEFVDFPAAAPFSGAFVRKILAQTIPNNTLTPVAWQTEEFDDGNWFDAVANDTIFTVPTGVTRVSISTVVALNTNNVGERELRLLVNTDIVARVLDAGFTATNVQVLSTAVSAIDVSAGDTIRVDFRHTAGISLDLAQGNASHLSVHALG